MVNVLINADDLGLHRAVTRAVKRFSEKGSLHSASVMANGPYAADAVFLKDQVLLGAHLNILRGKPMLPANEVPTLVTREGLFVGSYITLFQRYVTGRLNLEEIRKEWDAQIIFLKKMGLTLAHLDSEKHTHAWPKLMPIACELAKKHAIPRVRRPYEMLSGFPNSSGDFRAALLRYWSTKSPQEFQKKFTIPTVWGLRNQSTSFRYDAFKLYLKNNPKLKDIEIVCHPGIIEPGDLPLDPTFGKTRVESLWGPEAWSLENEAWGSKV